MSHKVEPTTSIIEKFPLILCDESGATFTKGGNCSRVVELLGRDYSGLDYAVIEALFQKRKLFFDTLPPGITVFVQSHRHKVTKDLSQEADSFSIDIAGEIAEQWAKNFKISYQTRHYLIFATADDSLGEQLLMRADKDSDESLATEKIKTLDNAVQTTLVQFADYGASEVKGDDLASYWAWLINGYKIKQKMPEGGFFDDHLFGSTLLWPQGKKIQIYEGPLEDIYSAWLIIKAPAMSTDHNLLESLFKLKKTFSIFQTFSRFDKQAALKEISDKEKNMQSFMAGGSDLIELEIREVENRVTADDISLVRHRFSIEVLEGSREELEKSVRQIINAVQTWGFQVAREGVNQEPLFWSRFPDMQKFNPRQKFTTSENAAHFATFASVGEGQPACTWGDAPVTQFQTAAGSAYSFIFHESTAKQAPGNTMIVGGMGKGKTVLISFLMSQCFRFPDFKALAFDRLHGLEVFTRFHNGSYLDFSEGVNVNPLMLDDSADNRAFLNTWFQMLTGKHDELSQDYIGNAISNLFELDKKDRTLEHIADAFGTKEEGSIRAALHRWLPGESMGSFFNGKTDALDFSSPMATFDNTTLLEVPDVLGPMTYYIFHKLFQTVRNTGGYLVFVDELAKYLKSKEFRPKIEVLLQEIRKTEGVFAGAVQDLGTVFNDEEMASKFRNNIATWVLFPEPLGEEKHYKDVLRLNDKEFKWVTQDHPRQVLIKKKSGESVILNVDLLPIGKYLNVFDSGKVAINRMNKLRAEDPTNWKHNFLNGS